jgi:uncharacterized protein YndB with AHSA1/START domain
MSTAAQLTPAHTTDSQAVRFERLLPGPIERVWDYLTKPDLQRTWLAESATELCDITGFQPGEITGCEPLRRLEYSMRDSSVVSFELEARGKNVLLVLTHHRRIPNWLAGAGTALAVALLVFSFSRPGDAIRPLQGLGSPILTRSVPALNSLRLKISSSEARPLYAMLGGRC